MDAIQETLGAILLLLAGVALVLLAIILLLVETSLVLRLVERLGRGVRPGELDDPSSGSPTRDGRRIESAPEEEGPDDVAC